MLRHILLISFRNFKKYSTSFLVNVTGLSTGIACVLLILLWVTDELSMDKFHANGDRLYQVVENVSQDNHVITRLTTAGPTAAALVAEMPEVEMAASSTVEWINSRVLSFDEKNIKANELWADQDFFKMFSFQLVDGNPTQVLVDKKSIVISKSLAVRLFGTTDNIVGRTVEYAHKKRLEVSGVMEDVPNHSSYRFDFILPFETFRDENDFVKSWFNTAPQTHLLLKPGTDVEAFNKKIADFVRIKTDGKAGHRTPFVRKFNESYLNGRYEEGKLAGGRIDYVRLFSIIAGFILLIACINFMNLSTARASRRLKEVGIKKTVGARRLTLALQYLSESLLMALISLAVAVGVIVLLLPQFNIITGKHLSLDFGTQLVAGLTGIVVLTGLVAGSYPALYLSRFNPVEVLKGRLSGFAGETWARKGLVMFQFTLSILLIVSVVVVYKQIAFIQNRSLGYNKDNILIITREGAVFEKQDAFLDGIRAIPGVAAASSSGHDMTGHNGGTYGVEWPGKDPNDRTEFERMASDYGLIELLGMEMKEGRSFSQSFGADNLKVIFNEAAIEFMGMKDPIGKIVKANGKELEIIGVVKDFHYETFHDPYKPAFFYIEPNHTGMVMIKIETGKEQETIAGLEKFYNAFNPGFPFTYRFLDDDYQKLYAAEHRVATLSKYFAALAVVISCLGLFGLTAFTAERRIKEIGIRKILGSGTVGIVYLLSSEFTTMVIAAIVIAVPASWFFASQWLEGFVFRVDLQWWFFAGSAGAALMVAWLTVAFQTFKAARVNPVECLRSE